jgi:hypothetical protein
MLLEKAMRRHMPRLSGCGPRCHRKSRPSLVAHIAMVIPASCIGGKEAGAKIVKQSLTAIVVRMNESH